ncbi:MAG: efflux RND transporter periplasmic adaptor subunit [Burkholderiales bacterium]|nr:efflux RND transporter periplasmic adaptor subunit [Burkholderiales bacterium]
MLTPAYFRTSSPRNRSVVIALAALLGMTGCQRAEEAPPPEVRPVRTMTVTKAAAGDVVTLTGTVQAQTEINQAFRIGGRLVERSVSVGDPIRPGQPIARLDDQNEQTSLIAARAQLDAARARQNEAQNMYERMRDLVAERAVSQAQFESAEAAARSARSAVEAASSQVTLAETRVSDTRLASNVAGVVTAQGPEPGEVVGAGQMIIQVARDGGRDAVFDMPARAKAVTTLNTPITVSLTADPRVTASTVVREISPRADPLTGTFRVRARIDKPPADMRLGSTITGRLTLASAEVIEIPPSAVVRADRQTAVWVVDAKTGTVSSRPIQIRSSDPNRVEVASGLNPGDVIVTAGVQALRPGQKVSLLKAAP